ncbi:hypothetical protein ACFL2V_13915 [Pseudomonadota bacterium]
MKLDWKSSKSENPSEATAGDNTEYVVELAECNENSNELIFEALTQATDKALSLLSSNVKDSSRYFMFEWDVVYSILTIVVTDELKEKDSQAVVKLSMLGMDDVLMKLQAESEEAWESKAEEYSSMVRHHVRDYLTTSNEFLQYSLIAIFHDGTREDAVLL